MNRKEIKNIMKEYVAGDVVKNKKGDIGVVNEVKINRINKVVFGDGKFLTMEDDDLVIIKPNGSRIKLNDMDVDEKEHILEPNDELAFKKYGKSYHQLNGDQRVIIDRELGEDSEGVSSL